MSNNNIPLLPVIVLFQPDIPGNTGTILRMATCLGLEVSLVEPAGFRMDDKSLQRSGMDYLERTSLRRHDDWNAFELWRKSEGRRLIALTTLANQSFQTFEFQAGDCLLFGRESAGLPRDVHDCADARLIIPMAAAGRSLNLAISTGMVVGEVLRQTGWPLDGIQAG